MLIKNPNEENDFVSGHTVCNGDVPQWNQRLTSSYGLVLTVSGKGSVSYQESTVCVKTGDLLLLKPLSTHLFCPLDSWDILWFHFLPRPHMSHVLSWAENSFGAGLISFTGKELDTISASLTEAHNLEFQRPQGWNELAYLLLEAAVVRGYNHSVSQSENTDLWIPLAEKMLTETTVDMDTIASCCKISRASLYNKFKKASGVSPRQYREYAMLRRAVPLLENLDLSIAEIAERIGMPDQYYFSTRFRKFSGFPPREYRRRAVMQKSGT